MAVRRSSFAWVPELLGLLAAAAAGWLILTVNYAGSRSAGWRHELICSALAAFAVYSATWAEGRSWPQPGAVYASAGLLAAVAALLLPLPATTVLAGLAIAVAAGGAVAVPLELRASRGAAPLSRLAVLAGMAVLVAVAPVFLWQVLRGVLS